MRGLDKPSLARLLQTVAPRGNVVRVRPLHGGISSSVYLVHLQTEYGGRQVVVLRRYGAYSQQHDPEACEREYRVLDALSRRGLPVPRPFLVDREGEPFLVMSRIAGRPQLAPRDVSDYLRQMAHTLVQIHRVPLDGLEFLSDQRVYVERAFRPDLAPSGDALREAVWAEAQRLWPSARASRRVALVHGDYWPGNILWNRARLVGVIDWEQPRVGDPTKDVATCRGDLSILFGLDAANEFLHHYTVAGGSVENLRFWDLLVSTWAVREIAEWATVYPLLGRPELTVGIARQRIRAFAQQVLDGPRPSGHHSAHA